MTSQKPFSPFVSHSAVDGLSVLFIIVLITLAEDVDAFVSEVPLPFLIAIAAVFALFVRRLYLLWKIVPPPAGGRSTTPGQAALLMVIPIVNVAWVFVALKRIADAANAGLRERGSAERISAGLSLGFAVLFVFTHLGLLYTRSIVFFCVFLLSLLFVMRRLVWQWRRAERSLTIPADGAQPSASVQEPGRTKTVFTASGIAAASLAVAFFIVTWYASSVMVSFSGYRARGHLSSLKRDLTSAYVAAQTYLAEHPKTVVVTAEQLKAGGWSGGGMNVFVSADMSAKQGRIVLKNRYLERKKKYAPGTGVVDANGKVTAPLPGAGDIAPQ
jgi:hypothetical protein